MATITNEDVKNRLKKLGVLKGKEPELEVEFQQFLARRQAAMAYNAASKQSDAAKSAPASNEAHRTVFSYYNPQEYPKGMTAQEYRTHLYRKSVSGGRTVTFETNEKEPHSGAKPCENPLGIEQCPQSNITVATSQTFQSHGGYFKKDYEIYSAPKTATVVHAYAYEFENFTPQMLSDGKCPFITKKSGNNPALPFGIKTDVTNNGEETKQLVASAQSETKLYLNAGAYKKFIKENLLKQMRALVHAHLQSGITAGIQMNLTLPGMGFFANLDALPTRPISGMLAQFAAEGYKEALEAFGKEQKNHAPQIKAIRISYPPDNAGGGIAQREAIEKAFELNSENARVTIGGIKVIRTTKFVEDLSDQPIESGLARAIFVNGDPRTYPGNEPGCTSQEPGIYSNAAGLRDIASPIVNPFTSPRYLMHETLHLVIFRSNPPSKESLMLMSKILRQN